MVKDAILKADLMRSSFGAPSDRRHDGLIGPFNPLIDVDDMVDMQYVDGENLNYFQIAFNYIFLDFLPFLYSLILLDFMFFWFL